MDKIPACAEFALPLNHPRANPKRQRRAIELMLTDWRCINRLRDELIREALSADISAREVQRRMGVARTTIARIATAAD